MGVLGVLKHPLQVYLAPSLLILLAGRSISQFQTGRLRVQMARMGSKEAAVVGEMMDDNEC